MLCSIISVIEYRIFPKETEIVPEQGFEMYGMHIGKMDGVKGIRWVFV